MGAQLGNEHRDPQGDRRRQDQRKDGRVERAPDEGQRTEVAGHRIPRLRAPEVETELPDGEYRLAGELRSNAGDDEDQQGAEGTGTDAKPRIARTPRRTDVEPRH